MPAAPAPRLRFAVRDEIRSWELSLDQMLAPDHPARTAWAFASRLDLAPLYAAIRAVEGHPGHPPADPRLLFVLWLYATLDGVGSARQLERLCADHTTYRSPCGGVSVNQHSLADFRVDHGEELLGRFLRAEVVASHFCGPDLIDDPAYYAALAELAAVARTGAPARLVAALGTGNRSRRNEPREPRR